MSRRDMNAFYAVNYFADKINGLSHYLPVLSLDKKNGKAIGRKIKAMCSLGKFREAQTIAKNWIKEDPKNPQAKKEVDRLDVILKALNEQVHM